MLGFVLLFVLMSADLWALDFAGRMKALRQRMATEGQTQLENDDNDKAKVAQPGQTKENGAQLQTDVPANKSPIVKNRPVKKKAVKKKAVKKKVNKDKAAGMLPLKKGWKMEADKAHSYRIQFPKTWQTSFLMDGPDRIKTGLAPDQNISVRVRSFVCGQGVTVELVKMAFEQRVLAGGTLLHTENGNLCGVPSNMSVYSGQFNNVAVNIVAVFMIRKDKGYIVWTMIPTPLFAVKSAAADEVLATFEFID